MTKDSDSVRDYKAEAEILKSSGLFDADWYLEHNPEAKKSNLEPVVHYLFHGAAEGKNPSAGFDSSKYIEHNPEIAESGINPLLHFIHGKKETAVLFPSDVTRDPGLLKDVQVIRDSGLFDSNWYQETYKSGGTDSVLHYLAQGAAEGKNPNPYFDTVFYLKTYPAVASSGMNPLVEYILIGREQHRKTHPGSGYLSSDYRRDLQLLKLSGLIDADWYLDKYPDVRESGLDPVEHYLFYGALDPRDPNPYFHTEFYLKTYGDVTESGLNPLIHYIQYGCYENRRTHPDLAINLATFQQDIQCVKLSGLFHVSWYLSQYSDVRDANMDPVEHYLLYGAGEGKNPNPYFDTKYYLSNHEDVVASGKNPLIHYIQHGAFEGTAIHPQLFLGELAVNPEHAKWGANPLSRLLWKNLPLKIDQPLSSGNSGKPALKSETFVFHNFPDTDEYGLKEEYRVNRNLFVPYRVVYISGFPNSSSHNYRVRDQVRTLNECNIPAAWIDLYDAGNYLHQLTFAEVVVLFRLPMTEEIQKITDVCKKAGVLIVYDTDDFVFDPEVANEKYVDGIRFLSPDDKLLYHRGVLQYRDALMVAQAGIFTTDQLAISAGKAGIPSSIIKNCYSRELYVNSCDALRQKENSSPRKTINIGYASGTLTHQKDFKVVSSVIGKLLKKYAHVKLVIVGELNIKEFPELSESQDQIEIRPLVPHNELAFELTRFDINIVPLEMDNPFCEAKSELKYFEAALVKVPTVASATAPYRRAISQGENGCLAATEKEWYDQLSALIEQKHFREYLGGNALTHSIATYGPDAKRNEVIQVFNKLFRKRRDLISEKRKSLNQTVTFVVPPMDKGSGGHAVIIDTAKWLTRWGQTVTLSFTYGSKDYSSARQIEEEFKLDITKIRATINSDLPAETNLVFATHWTTVYVIEKSTKQIGRKYYFLQDYEAYFHPMSSDYIRAVNTYSKDFIKISIGSWIKRMLSDRHGIHDTRVFPFFYNKKIYNIESNKWRSNNKIIYFARPHMLRRCFDLGIQVLKRYMDLYGEKTEVLMFGTIDLKYIDIPFTYTDLGVMSPQRLADLYRSGTVGMVFSPTNPSKAPYEMMACGLPVMDIDIEGNDVNYGGRGNVYLVQPDIDEMAEALHRIMTDKKSRELVSESAYQFVSTFPDEEEAARIVSDYLESDAKKERSLLNSTRGGDK
jgi:glycosyltransferase involved in cell wall biosynthesis